LVTENETALELPAARCGESSILTVIIFYDNRSLTPLQAAGNALAPGFMVDLPGIVNLAFENQ
jgi:hypothetical protein